MRGSKGLPDSNWEKQFVLDSDEHWQLVEIALNHLLDNRHDCIFGYIEGKSAITLKKESTELIPILVIDGLRFKLEQI